MERLTLDQLARRFIAAPVKMHASVGVAMVKAAILVRDTATKKFGEYQPAVGEYPAWEQLTIDTVTQKMNHGAPGPNPLIGAYGKDKYQEANQSTENAVWPAPLRNTISIHVDGWVAQVGSDDPLAEWHEYGVPDPSGEHAKTGAGKDHTTEIPPRPFLRPALFEKAEEIQEILNEGMFLALRNL